MEVPMFRSLCCIAVLALFSLTLTAQFNLTPNPASLAFSPAPGQYDSRVLTIGNGGAETEQYSLLAHPPSLLANQVGYYPLDAGTADLIGGGAGSFTTPRWSEDRLGRPQGAARFLGGANHFDTPDYGLANNFSLSFWARPLNNQTMYAQTYYNIAIYTNYLLWPDWYDYGPNGGLGIALGQNGIMVIEHAAAYMPVLLSYSADLSGWNHYVIKLTAQVPQLYVNGSLVRTGIASQKSYTRLSHIYGGSSYGYFKGHLDELCIYNTPLTDAQIQQSYQYTDQSRFIILPRTGELDPGQQDQLLVRMIDGTLGLGTHDFTLSLCQQGSTPLFLTLPVTVNVSGLAIPLPPDALTVTLLPNGDTQLDWLPVTQSETGGAISVSSYRIYGGDDPSRPELFACLGSTVSTSFTHPGTATRHRFYSVVAFIE